MEGMLRDLGASASVTHDGSLGKWIVYTTLLAVSAALLVYLYQRIKARK